MPPTASGVATIRLSELCQILQRYSLEARVDGADSEITAVNTLQDARPGEITFLSNVKYQDDVKTTKASAVIAKDGVPMPGEIAAIRCSDPYTAVTIAIIAIHGYRKHPQWGISEHACVDPSAKIGKNANIANGVSVARDVTIGDNCTFYPGCYIADGVRIGDDCTFYPNVVVYDDCVIGHRVTVHAGTCIGQDGLGYAPRDGSWLKIPQVGRTIIHDDVEIGANCAIDRATLGTTEIGAGTKFGNVIVIGHGTKVGADCMFAGVVGVAGSATIGKHVTVAGHAGIAGHLSIGDNATIAAKSGISNSVPANTTVFGAPAIPIEEARRVAAVTRKLPKWTQRIRKLEREMKELRALLQSQEEA